MHALAVPYLAACLLVGLAGVAKVRRPLGTSQALRAQGLPSASWLVRGLGVAELLLAAAALAQLPGSAAGVTLAYLSFSAFVVLALLRNRPLSSCGCFGRADVPPSWGHVVLTLAAAVVAVAVSLGPAAGLPALLAAGPVAACAVAGSVALVSWLAFLLFTRPTPVALGSVAS